MVILVHSHHERTFEKPRSRVPVTGYPVSRGITQPFECVCFVVREAVLSSMSELISAYQIPREGFDRLAFHQVNSALLVWIRAAEVHIRVAFGPRF